MNYTLRDTITGRSTTDTLNSPSKIYWTSKNNIYLTDLNYYSYFLTGNNDFINWELSGAPYQYYPLGSSSIAYFDSESGIIFAKIPGDDSQLRKLNIYTGNIFPNNIFSGLAFASEISGNRPEYNENEYSFGRIVDYKNNVLLAGAPSRYGSTYIPGSSGAAYIFTGSKNNWVKIIKLTGSKSILSDYINNGFGASLSLNSQGTIAAVSSPYESALGNYNLNGFHKGCVYIFSGNNSSDWKEISRLTGNYEIIPALGYSDADFGKKLKINSLGDTLYVLSSLRLSIFTGNNNNWNLARQIFSNDFINGNPWGMSDFEINQSENILYLSSGRLNTTAIGIDIFSGLKDNWILNGKVQLVNSTTTSYEAVPSRVGFKPNFSGNILGVQGITTSVPGGYVFQIYKEQLNQTITFPSIPTKSFGDPVFYLSGSSDSNLPLTYTSSNTGVARITGADGVLISRQGTTVITATQTGNSDFSAASPVSRSLYVRGCNNFAQISAGFIHSSAILEDGKITGWGDNTFGQINVPVKTGINPIEVSAGQYHSLALLKDGSITGWGYNGNGQTNIPVGIGTGATGISAGNNYSLALLKDGSITGWGINNSGQLNIPAGIGTGAAQVSAGAFHALALLKDGSITGWGYNGNGQTNIPVGIGTGAAQVSAGTYHSLALLKDGRITGWGSNNVGQITIPAGIGTGAAQISAGDLHSLALLKDGRATGWGNNTLGQSAITIPVGIGTNAIEVSAGGVHSLALLKDGTVTGWGNNFYGQTNIPILKCPQTITFPAIPTKVYGDLPFYLSGTSTSNLQVTYTTSNPTIATIAGSQVTIVGAGTCNITANQSGNIEYESAPPVSTTLTVNKANQTLNFPAIANKKYSDITFNITATSNVLPVTFYPSNNIVSINSNIASILSTGSFIITAVQSGNSLYNPVTGTQTAIIDKGDQIITFPEIGTKYLSSPTFSLIGSATSSLPIAYSIDNTGVATLVGSSVSIKSVGSATITATQTGNQFWNAASSVNQILNVESLPFLEIAKLKVGDIALGDNSRLYNTLNYNIEISGNPVATKEFTVEDNEPFYFGLTKDVNYKIISKSREKLFDFGKTNSNLIVSSNSYTNTANINIDFSENEKDSDIENNINDIIYITYKMDEIFTPSGTGATNQSALKAFTIDFKAYFTGETDTDQEVPFLFYNKNSGEKVCNLNTINPIVAGEENKCNANFKCIICSEGLKIQRDQPSQTFIEVPKNILPYRVYQNDLDYIFTSDTANSSNYRIALNARFNALCCQCQEDDSVNCAETLSKGYGYGADGSSQAEGCGIDKLFDRPSNVNDNSTNQQYSIYYLDALSLSAISDNYGPHIVYSGEIGNVDKLVDGDKITINQYSYPYQDIYKKIYNTNPIYPAVNTEFIYSSSLTGDKYFYGQDQLIDKINNVYNTTGIYTWLPMLYSKNPKFNYSKMLSASKKDDRTVTLVSLKSGRLGEHSLKIELAPRSTISTYLLPKIIKLEGSDDGISWNTIVSSEIVQPINILGSPALSGGGAIKYGDIKYTEVNRTIEVPTSSTVGSRIVPSGETSGQLNNIINQITSGNRNITGANGNITTCVASVGSFSKICGSGFYELMTPSGCPLPEEEEKQQEEEEKNKEPQEETQSSDTVKLIIKENTLRVAFGDYRGLV